MSPHCDSYPELCHSDRTLTFFHGLDKHRVVPANSESVATLRLLDDDHLLDQVIIWTGRVIPVRVGIFIFHLLF